MAGPIATLNWFKFEYRRSMRRARPRQIARYLNNLFRKPPPRHGRTLVSIGLTHRCQKKCEWCATARYQKDREGEFSTGEVQRLLREIASSKFAIDNVSYMGGEPLLRPDLSELVHHASNLGLFVHLSTNGIRLDGPGVGLLRDSGLNSVFVAWDPVLASHHRVSDRRGAVLQGLLACVHQGLPAFLSVCVTRENVCSGDLEGTIDMAREMGLSGVRLLPVRPTGRWLGFDQARALTASEEWKVRSLCLSGYAFVTDDCCKELGVKCPAIDRRVVYISPYGDVQPCHYLPVSFGNVRETRFDSILDRMWSSPLLRADGWECILTSPASREVLSRISTASQLPLRA